MAARVSVFSERSLEGALTAPLGALLIAWAGGRAAGWQFAALWFVALCIVEFLIVLNAYRFLGNAPDKPDPLTQARRLIILSILSGLLWGFAAFVFWADGQFKFYLLILTILVGVCAVSISIMSTFLGALITFYAALLLPPLVHALLTTDPTGLKIAVGLAILYVLMLQHGSVVGQRLVGDLESTVRNEMLAERLRLALDAAHQDWFDLNPQSGEMLASVKYSKPDIAGLKQTKQGLQTWTDVIHPDDLPSVRTIFSDALNTDDPAEAEYRVRAPNQAWMWIRSVGRVIDRDGDGKAVRVIGIHSDITESKRQDEQIKTLAFYDHLTNLPNRRLLSDRIKQAMASAARHKQYGALLMLDLDNFKALNDTRGHDIGDKFLVAVAWRLESCVRKIDTVARQGGDEFLVLIECLGEREEAAVQARIVAQKTLDAISKPYLFELTSAAGQPHAYSHQSTASIGVALFSHHDTSVDDLVKSADTAMYQAKALGRNAFRFFDLEMQEEVAARAALDSELREAVQKNQFVLYYQPQVNEAGRMTGAEALLRWLHPRDGVVTPDRFIAATESTGLILPIGRFVMDTACAQLVAWAAQPETAHLTLSVNVSVVQFRDHDFMDHTLATVELSGIDPRKLTLEITESLLMDDAQGIIEKMFQLRSSGIGFSLDDFGTGYSSLSYLKRLPIGQLKIDKAYIRDVLTDANDAAITRTIIALAKSMGLDVIAEGVETEGQQQFLAANGCLAYQGYLFARPAPLAELAQYLNQTVA